MTVDIVFLYELLVVPDTLPPQPIVDNDHHCPHNIPPDPTNLDSTTDMNVCSVPDQISVTIVI